MSSASELVGGALAVFGCAVAVVATIAMYLVRSVDDRLHLMAPLTTVAGPFIAAGLITYNGASSTSAQVAVVVAVLAMTGPAITASIARAKAERSDPQRNEEPE